MIVTLASYDFAAGQPGAALLGAGWSPPGPDGAWSLAGAAEFILPKPDVSAGLALELTLDTQETFAIVRYRHVTVSVNGAELVTRRLGGKLRWHIDLPAAMAGPELAVRLRIAGSLPGARGVRLISCAILRCTHAALPPPQQPLRQFRFGWNEPTETMLGEGWGRPEDEFVWAIGGASTLRIPLHPAAPPSLALIDMRPFHRQGQPARQRVTLSVNGLAADIIELEDRLTVAVDLPAARGQTSVTLGFTNHDADFETSDPLFHYGKPFAWALASVRLVPALPRYLPGFRPRLPGTLADGTLQQAVLALTGIPAADLAARFEGLGNGCELGLLQRDLGRDNSGLLRFAAITQRDLVEGLLHGFHGVARLERLEWDVRRPQDDTWRLVEKTYGLSSASPYLRSEPKPEDKKPAMSRRLPRLADKLMEDITGGEKIFVLRISEKAAAAAAKAVLAALRHFGGADMIWLVTDGSRQPGSVERLAGGLIRGHLESPETGLEVAPDTMLSALANAHVLLLQAQPLPPDWQNP